MGHHLRARLLGEAHCAAEVIGVRMGDDDGMDVLGRHAGLLQAVLERLPGAGARHARVDHGAAVGVKGYL